MIQWPLIQEVFVKWVQDNALNYNDEDLGAGQVIFEDQSEQRPSGPYASLKVIAGPQRIGHDVLLNATPDFSISGLREFTLSVSLYRTDALERAASLHSKIQDPLILEMFQAIGLAYISETPIRDLTRPVGPRFEKRFQFDVRFRLADNIATNPGLIEEVNAEGTVDGSIGPDITIELNAVKP